jgi:uncharacterized membrane protein YeaQ/YmgE (transglycosylase-associated protein family)
MPLLLLIVIAGSAAGFFATRLMRAQTDLPTTIVIGITGVILGTVLLRMMVAVTGGLALFVAAVLGGMAVIWLWRSFVRR